MLFRSQGLIDLGFPMPVSTQRYGSPDGIFGKETTAKVREFQSKNGLSPDGIVGKNTMARLDQLLPNAGEPLPPLPKGDFTHKVRLHFRSIGVPQIPELTALLNAQRVYAQYGINMEFASGQSLKLTDDEQLKLNVIDGQCQWDQANDEQKLLFGLGGMQGVGPNDILVYYVQSIQQTDGSSLNGCAGHEPTRPAVVVASTGTPWTLGHEVGHVLLGSSFTPVHASSTTNLMYAPTSSITGNPPTLTPEQVKAIKKSKCCVPV